MTDYVGNIAFTGGEYALVKFEPDVGKAKKVDMIEVMGGDHSAPSAPQFAGHVSLKLLMRVYGTSASTLQTNLAALLAEIAQPRNTYLHDRGDGTLAAFTILESERPSVSYDLLRLTRHRAEVSATLNVAPFAAGALQTIHDSATVAAPDSLSLATLYGDLPVPLRTYLDDASGLDIHSLYLALAPRALTDTKWIIDESQWSWSSDSTTTGIGEYSDAVQRENATTADAGTLDVSGYPAGIYRLVARVAVAAGYGYVRTNLAGADTDVTITNTTLALVELGDVWLPPSATKSGTASNLIVYLTGDGSNYAYFDYLLALPLWLGFCSIHPASTSQEFDECDLGPSGLFLDGVTDWTDVVGDVLRPRTTAMLCPELITTHSPDGSGTDFAARTNLCTNPKFGADLTLWAAAPADCVITRETSPGVAFPDGIASCAKTVYTGTATRQWLSDPYAVEAGETYTVSGYAYVPAIAATGSFRLYATVYNGAAYVRDVNICTVTAVTSSFVRYSAQVIIAGAGETHIKCNVYHRYANITSYATGFLVEKAGALADYFDGSYPMCDWTGTADLSTSTQTAYTLMDDYPADWTRNDTDYAIAATIGGEDVFAIDSTTTTVSAYAGPFVVTPHEWYELAMSKQVTAWTSADVNVYARWYDVALNQLSETLLANYAATDAAPVAVSLYAQAPTDAAYGRVYVETEAAADTTVQFSDVYFHRCPLNLLIASEDAAGTAGTQDVAVTVQAVPRYEGGR